nr:uncharacterized protein CTRU02_05632 [Colletotrichum truncatum]KAF6794075.1 hypothetical protein CTRU02_05632 [Colletotrichum truncatum]
MGGLGEEGDAALGENSGVGPQLLWPGESLSFSQVTGHPASNVTSSSEKEAKRGNRCRWKDCSYIDPGLDHILQHRKCPKNDCVSSFREEKEKRRHVWKVHRNWATQMQYPRVASECDICGMMLARKDYVLRHKRRKHWNQRQKNDVS